MATIKILQTEVRCCGGCVSNIRRFEKQNYEIVYQHLRSWKSCQKNIFTNDYAKAAATWSGCEEWKIAEYRLFLKSVDQEANWAGRWASQSPVGAKECIETLYCPLLQDVSIWKHLRTEKLKLIILENINSLKWWNTTEGEGKNVINEDEWKSWPKLALARSWKNKTIIVWKWMKLMETNVQAHFCDSKSWLVSFDVIKR